MEHSDPSIYSLSHRCVWDTVRLHMRAQPLGGGSNQVVSLTLLSNVNFYNLPFLKSVSLVSEFQKIFASTFLDDGLTT